MNRRVAVWHGVGNSGAEFGVRGYVSAYDAETGGLVWDAIVYDPESALLYIGVGNGSPWNRSKVEEDAKRAAAGGAEPHAQ